MAHEPQFAETELRRVLQPAEKRSFNDNEAGDLCQAEFHWRDPSSILWLRQDQQAALASRDTGIPQLRVCCIMVGSQARREAEEGLPRPSTAVDVPGILEILIDA